MGGYSGTLVTSEGEVRRPFLGLELAIWACFLWGLKGVGESSGGLILGIEILAELFRINKKHAYIRVLNFISNN